jgi:UDP-glucose 4-epimerase
MLDLHKHNSILVTGCSGFIGGHLCESLKSLSPESSITGIDKTEPSAARVTSLTSFDLIDLSTGIPTARMLREANCVFHLAANPEVRIGISDTNADYENNIVATRNLLESLRLCNFHGTFVFASSSTVYGEAFVIPTPETYGPLIPISMYGASKLSCESLICAYAKLFHFEAKIVRFANVVGGHSRHGVIFDFVRKLLANPKSLEILGDGKQLKSYVHIEDCVSGIINAVGVGQDVDIFNLGTEQTTDVLKIARIAAEEMGVNNVVFETGYGKGEKGSGWPGDVKNMLLDCKKFSSLGWKNSYSSDEAVRKAVQETVEMTAH